MKCIEHWYMQLYFQLKIQITKSAYTDYWWAAIGVYVSEFLKGTPDLIMHTTIFIISFFSLFDDNESVMAYPATTVTKIVQGNWRIVHPQLPFSHAKFEPHPSRTSFSLCYGTRQTPSATVIAVRVLLLSASQPYSLDQVSRDLNQGLHTNVRIGTALVWHSV